MDSAPPKKWLKTKQAAEYLQVTPLFIYKLADQGHITRYKKNNRCCWFSIDELDRYVESQAEENKPAA